MLLLVGGMMTWFCSPTTPTAFVTSIQFVAVKSLFCCKTKPVNKDGHETITTLPECVMVNTGAGCEESSVMTNLLPSGAVPMAYQFNAGELVDI